MGFFGKSGIDVMRIAALTCHECQLTP